MPIQDLAGNPLPFGTQGQMLGFVEPPAPEEVLTLEIYRFILEGIRHADQQEGALFLKRYLNGPQAIWKDTQARIFSIKTLWDIIKVEDVFLKFIKRIVGWTPDLDHITGALDASTLRKLIAASIPLWQRRGPEDTIINILSLVTGARLRTWNWFEFRWVLDETALSEDHEGRDPLIINLPGPPANDEFRSNVRIVDNGSLNRELVENLVKLMRASGERIEVSYITFLDRFRVDGDTLQWTAQAGALPVIAAGKALLDGVVQEITVTNVTGNNDWVNYVFYTRIRGKSPASGNEYGVAFYRTSSTNYYTVALDSFANRVRLKKVVAGVPTTLVDFDYSTIPGTLFDNTWYGLRVQVSPVGSTNQIRVYIDAQLTIDTTDSSHAKGRIGLYHSAGANDTEYDEIEMFKLPLATTAIEVNP